MEAVNVLAVVASGVIGFIYAGAWFRILGPTWQGMLTTSKEDRQKGSRRALLLTLIIYIFVSFVLAEYLQALHVHGAGNGALQGLYIGIGFAASHGLVSNLFRAEPLKLFLVEYGQVVSTMVLMGLILGVWP